MLLNFEPDKLLVRSNRFDPELCDLADRHYSRQKHGANQFVRPGECLVLRDTLGTIVFVWSSQKFRLDNQTGVECVIFRNESDQRSSDLILEAEKYAVERWGSTRGFTFINSKRIRSTNPGCCFKKAGWRFAGMNKEKHIFEKDLA